MSKLCFLGMDGVLADFVEGVFRLRGLPGHSQEGLRWDFVQSHEWDQMNYGFWVNLPVLEYGREIMAAALEAYGPDRVCILSSPVHPLGCVKGKRDWLLRHFPELPEGNMLFGNKKAFCARPGALLVDAHDKNLNGWRKSGGKTLLVPQPWNCMSGTPRGYVAPVIGYYGRVGCCARCEGTQQIQVPEPTGKGLAECPACMPGWRKHGKRLRKGISGVSGDAGSYQTALAA